MSYTITTDVFCDGHSDDTDWRCVAWMSEGGVVSHKVLKSDADKRAKTFGWEKLKGKHLCPSCVKKRKLGYL